jgi:hypothetical protein
MTTFTAPIDREEWFRKDCLVLWADADEKQVKCVVRRTSLRVGFEAESGFMGKGDRAFQRT